MPKPYFTQTLARLKVAAEELGVLDYSYDPGDNCCDDHWMASSESLEPASAQYLAIELAYAYAGASRKLPKTQVHAADLLSTIFRGESYSDSPYEHLRTDGAKLDAWIESNTPDPERFREKLAAGLLGGEASEKKVVRAEPGAEGAWEVTDEETDASVWVRPLSEEEAASLAAAAVLVG